METGTQPHRPKHALTHTQEKDAGRKEGERCELNVNARIQLIGERQTLNNTNQQQERRRDNKFALLFFFLVVKSRTRPRRIPVGTKSRGFPLYAPRNRRHTFTSSATARGGAAPAPSSPSGTAAVSPRRRAGRTCGRSAEGGR